jgi:hypothetical protein
MSPLTGLMDSLARGTIIMSLRTELSANSLNMSKNNLEHFRGGWTR